MKKEMTETETKMQAQAPAKALIPEYKDVQESKCEKRVNDDAKFNLTFAEGVTCAAHILHYASRNPRYFGRGQ